MKKKLLSLYVVILLGCLVRAQQIPPVVTASELDLPLVISITTVTSANVQIIGNPGTGAYYYWAVSNFVLGSTAPVLIGSITNGPNSLSSTNKISITPNFFGSSATSTDILRTTTPNIPLGACNCAVATTVMPGAQVLDQSNSLLSYTIGVAIDPGKYPLSLANEVVSLGATHLILRQNGLFVCDLSIGCGSGGSLTIQVDGVNTLNQNLINFVDTSGCTWTNPSGGIVRVTCTGSGGLTGSGTAGFVPVWTGTTSLGNSNSIFFNSAGTLGINSNPTGASSADVQITANSTLASGAGSVGIQAANGGNNTSGGGNVNIFSGSNTVGSTGTAFPGQIIIQAGQDNSTVGIGAQDVDIFGGGSVNGHGGRVALIPNAGLGTAGSFTFDYNAAGSFMEMTGTAGHGGAACIRYGLGVPPDNTVGYCAAGGSCQQGSLWLRQDPPDINDEAYLCGGSPGYTWSPITATGTPTTFQANGSALTSSSTINFLNSSTFNGLTFTFSNPSAGNVQIGATGTLANSGLTNSSTTVNGQTCALGSSCTITTGTGTVTNAANLANALHTYGTGTTGIASAKDAILVDPFISATPNDAAATINAALAAAVTNGVGVVDATALQGLQPCASNIWHGENVPTQIKFNPGGVIFVCSTSQWTPQVSHTLDGINAASDSGANGVQFVACGPLVANSAPGVTWTGTTCTFTNSLGAQTVQGFAANDAFPLTFQYAHGPAPAGTSIYHCVVCVGGQGSSGEKTGWNSNGLPLRISGISVSAGGVANTFPIYIVNSNENTVFEHIRTGGFASGSNFNAGIFFDRTEAPTGQSSHGPARSVFRDVNMALNGLSAPNPQAIGILVEGESATVVIPIGTCSTQPKAVVTGVSGGAITSLLIDPLNNGTTGCTNGASVTVNGPGATYGSTPNTSATVTTVVSGGAITGFNISSGGTNYINSFLTGCPAMYDINEAGQSGDNMLDGIMIDGCINPLVEREHTINLSGYSMEFGLYGFVAGGQFFALDNGGSGNIVHNGSFIDGNQVVQGAAAGSGTLIKDDFNGNTLTAATYPQGIGEYNYSTAFLAGNEILGGNLLPNVDGGSNLGSSSKEVGAAFFTQPSGGATDVTIKAAAGNTGILLQGLNNALTSQFSFDASGNEIVNTVAAAGVVSGTQGNFSNSVNVGSSPPTACGSATACIAGAEASTAGTPTASQDYCRWDSSHLEKCSINNGAEFSSMRNDALPAASQFFLGSDTNSNLVGNQPWAINAQTTTYTTVAADFTACKTIPIASGTFTVTMLSTVPASGQCVRVVNYGSGVITVAPGGSNTFNGVASNLTLAAGSASAPTGVWIVSAGGTSYIAQPLGANSGGGVASFTGDGNLINNSTSTGVVTVTLANAAAFSLWGNSTSIAAAPNYTATPNVTSIATGNAPPACTAGTAGAFCAAEGTAFTNVSGAGGFYLDSTAHEFEAKTNGASAAGVLVRAQPGSIHQTGQTASIGTSTLCAASAGACNVAGEYHVHWDFIQTGTACSVVTAGGVTFSLTWTDSNGTTRTVVVPMIGEGAAATTPALNQNFFFQTSLGNGFAGGDFTISTNGSVIQYATTYTACTTGTGTYQLDAAVTRLQ